MGKKLDNERKRSEDRFKVRMEHSEKMKQLKQVSFEREKKASEDLEKNMSAKE